jgi:hypothetical protein
MTEPTLHTTLSNAAAGYYVEYTQSANETGHDGDTLVYVGPFATLDEASAELEQAARKDAKIIRK